MQITGEIERSDIPYEGEESFEGELSEDVSQDRDEDASDDVNTVGQLRCLLLPVTHLVCMNISKVQINETVTMHCGQLAPKQ